MQTCEAVIAFLFCLPDRCGQCFLLWRRYHAFDLARTNPDCREHLEAIFNSRVGLFESAVLRAGKGGAIRLGPAKRTVILLLSRSTAPVVAEVARRG